MAESVCTLIASPLFCLLYETHMGASGSMVSSRFPNCACRYSRNTTLVSSSSLLYSSFPPLQWNRSSTRAPLPLPCSVTSSPRNPTSSLPLRRYRAQPPGWHNRVGPPRGFYRYFLSRFQPHRAQRGAQRHRPVPCALSRL